MEESVVTRVTWGCDSDMSPDSYVGLSPGKLWYASLALESLSLDRILGIFFEGITPTLSGAHSSNLPGKYARACRGASERTRTMADAAGPHANKPHTCGAAA